MTQLQGSKYAVQLAATVSTIDIATSGSIVTDAGIEVE
jgi:hypothetical protein